MGFIATVVLTVSMLFTSVVEAAPRERSRHLTRAIDAIGERDYPKAKVHLRLALTAGGHTHADTVLIYRLSGEVAAAFGLRAEAQRFFQRMLALDPLAEVAVSQIPKVVEPYDGARAYFSGERSPLSIAYDYDKETRVITMRVIADPFSMVKGIRLIYGEGDRQGIREQPFDGGDVPIVVPEGQEASSWLTVVDAHGNELRPLEAAVPSANDVPPPQASLDAAEAFSVSDDPVYEATAQRSLIGRWYVWGILTVGAAGTAAIFGARANEDWRELDDVISDSEKYDFVEANSLERSGRRKALVANIALGTAITTATVATILLIRDVRAGNDQPEKRQRLGAVPLRGGAAVTWEMGF